MYPRTTFEDFAKRPDDALDVALGAAIVAKDVYESLEPEKLIEQLDVLAAPLVRLDLDGMTPLRQAETVTERFRDLGFRGNGDDYYDPRNSLLPDVLERRLGIPITLSIVWCELATRSGVRASGVGFPGHFLVRVDDPHGAGLGAPPIIVDPFANGRVLDDEGAEALLRRALGDGAAMHATLFAPASPRAILVRLLTNLKAIWASRGDHARAFVAIDRIVTLVPDSPRMLRERAGIALRLGIVELARADLSRVLELEPEAPDIPAIERRLAQLAGPGGMIN
jgi:regulator of sirC expression with transglutaminase-like and TPR domain